MTTTPFNNQNQSIPTTATCAGNNTSDVSSNPSNNIISANKINSDN